MPDLLLHDADQAAMRLLLSSELAGSRATASVILPSISRLIACDAIGIEVLDRGGSPVAAAGSAAMPHAYDRLTVEAWEGAAGRRLWLVRFSSRFAARDKALFALLTPALEQSLAAQAMLGPATRITAQERRVLMLVSAGLTNSEVAAELSVAPSTISKHLEHAYRKLGVTNRTAAVHALHLEATPARS